MKEWDRDRISEFYLRQAQEAERYCNEVRGKIKRTFSYEAVFDEHMAKFYVYNYLHGRTFLESRESLLEELNEMLSQKVAAADCFDQERFDLWRNNYINYEIKKHEST
ncbi:hypothetical protein [Methylophaga sp.]|uniref:hypothetical protein n=1 Tax=Methylophaga sp. TaxID=2024840 RepID=UPI003F72ECCD